MLAHTKSTVHEQVLMTEAEHSSKLNGFRCSLELLTEVFDYYRKDFWPLLASLIKLILT